VAGLIGWLSGREAQEVYEKNSSQLKSFCAQTFDPVNPANPVNPVQKNLFP
jgi:hypothetical protein